MSGSIVGMLFRTPKKITDHAGQRRADNTRMRDHNTTLLLQMAWWAGEISRIDLSRRSGLAPSTVSSIVGRLLDQGLLHESHAKRTRGGRPPIVLRFDDDRFQLLGIDMGATHVSVALTNLRGRVLAWRSSPHAMQPDPAGTLALIEEQVAAVLDEHGSTLASVVGAGLAVPSPVDSQDPDGLSERILPAWAGIRPAASLRERLGIPVFIGNDANLCALAEAWLGSGREADTLAFIKLGTGIGAGLIVEGEMLRGANGFAGEIGHTAIDSSGPTCECGLKGCLQAMVGSAAIQQRVRLGLEQGQDSALAEIDHPSLKAIALAAAAGDPLATAAVAEAGRHLGTAIANLFNLVNPSLVLLGGGLTAAGDTLLDPLREAIRARTLWASLANADIAIGGLGDRTAALGAATLVLRAALADPAIFTERNHTLPTEP